MEMRYHWRYRWASSVQEVTVPYIDANEFEMLRKFVRRVESASNLPPVGELKSKYPTDEEIDAMDVLELLRQLDKHIPTYGPYGKLPWGVVTDHLVNHFHGKGHSVTLGYVTSNGPQIANAYIHDVKGANSLNLVTAYGSNIHEAMARAALKTLSHQS